MATGLSLGLGGRFRATSSPFSAVSGTVTGGKQAATNTVSAGAFGPGSTTAPTSGSKATLSPTRPFGVGFWSAVGAVVVLAVIRHALPR